MPDLDVKTSLFLGESAELAVWARIDGTVYMERTDSLRPGPGLDLTRDQAIDLAIALLQAARA